MPAMYVANTGQLAVYASGRNSAITLNIGDGVADIVQIYEGNICYHRLCLRGLMSQRCM